MTHEAEPDIKLGGFSLWIKEYDRSSTPGSWDDSWVDVVARCVGQNTLVGLESRCVRQTELAQWLQECIAFDAGKSDAAELPTCEPYLKIKIDRSGLSGGLVAIIHISWDNDSEFHEYRYTIDPSHVRGLITSLRVILSRFPIRSE